MSVKTKVGESRQNSVEHRRELAKGINALFDGLIRSHDTVTLDVNSFTTTVSSTFVSDNSLILLMPTTANAAQETYYITVSQEQFIVTHNSNSQTDRTFKYIVLGA